MISTTPLHVTFESVRPTDTIADIPRAQKRSPKSLNRVALRGGDSPSPASRAVTARRGWTPRPSSIVCKTTIIGNAR